MIRSRDWAQWFTSYKTLARNFCCSVVCYRNKSNSKVCILKSLKHFRIHKFDANDWKMRNEITTNLMMNFISIDLWFSYLQIKFLKTFQSINHKMEEKNNKLFSNNILSTLEHISFLLYGVGVQINCIHCHCQMSISLLCLYFALQQTNFNYIFMETTEK